MKKNLVSNLNFITGILFIINSILNLISNKTLLGITYICIAITFISLGLNYRKKQK